MDGGPEKSNALEFEAKKHSTKEGSVFGEALKRSRGFMGVVREKNMQVMCDLTAGFVQYCKCMFAISHLPLTYHFCCWSVTLLSPPKTLPLHFVSFLNLCCVLFNLHAFAVFFYAFDLSGPP